MLTILLIVLVIMAIGSVPAWPHSRNWGYFPSGGLGLLIVILLVVKGLAGISGRTSTA